MADFIIVAVIAILVCASLLYIRKEKKRGVTCIGCPSAGVCARKRNAASGCSCGSSNCHTETH